MSIKFRTDTPSALLTKFKKLIAQDEPKGRINTWEEYVEAFVTQLKIGKIKPSLKPKYRMTKNI